MGGGEWVRERYEGIGEMTLFCRKMISVSVCFFFFFEIVFFKGEIKKLLVT